MRHLRSKCPDFPTFTEGWFMPVQAIETSPASITRTSARDLVLPTNCSRCWSPVAVTESFMTLHETAPSELPAPVSTGLRKRLPASPLITTPTPHLRRDCALPLRPPVPPP